MDLTRSNLVKADALARSWLEYGVKFVVPPLVADATHRQSKRSSPWMALGRKIIGTATSRTGL